MFVLLPGSPIYDFWGSVWYLAEQGPSCQPNLKVYSSVSRPLPFHKGHCAVEKAQNFRNGSVPWSVSHHKMLLCMSTQSSLDFMLHLVNSNYHRWTPDKGSTVMYSGYHCRLTARKTWVQIHQLVQVAFCVEFVCSPCASVGFLFPDYGYWWL